MWEEYTRPARYVRDSKLIVMPPLSEPELMDFHIGGHDLTLEAFNTDGLRTLLTTMKGRIPNMREKTFRFPGHIAWIKRLQETGETWVPEKWTAREDEDEFTIMRIHFRGSRNGRPRKIAYTMFVTWDPQTGMSSMSRATGYSCTGVARCILDGSYQRKGISPPSYIGEAPGCADQIFAHLTARGILLKNTKSSFDEQENSFLAVVSKGHDFSRAEKGHKRARALAPEGCFLA